MREHAHGGEVCIGTAGQSYASREWAALLAALDSADWRIAGQQVKVRLIGRDVLFYASAKSFIEYLGWRPQDEAIGLLAETDVLYCPYLFDNSSTYLAAQRPVLVHGPKYSETARLIAKHNAGECCESLDSRDIIRDLTSLAAGRARRSGLPNP